MFLLDKDSADNNSIFLEWCDFDMRKLIQMFKESHIDYGSEFRNMGTLEKLLYRHNFWKHTVRINVVN